MADVTFDGTNKLILINNGITSLNIKEVYSWWKDWVLQGDNLKYLPAMASLGGDPLPGGLFLGSTFFLENGWKIRPYEGNHSLNIIGNLYSRDGSFPFVQTLGSYNVLITSTVSQLVQGISTGSGTGGDTPTATEIANAVWNKPMSENTNSGTFGEFIQKKLLSVAKFIGLK